MNYLIDFEINGFGHKINVQLQTDNIGMSFAVKLAKKVFESISSQVEQKRMDFWAIFNNKKERLLDVCNVIAMNIETAKVERSTGESIMYEVVNQLLRKIQTMESSFTT